MSIWTRIVIIAIIIVVVFSVFFYSNSAGAQQNKADIITAKRNGAFYEKTMIIVDVCAMLPTAHAMRLGDRDALRSHATREAYNRARARMRRSIYAYVDMHNAATMIGWCERVVPIYITLGLIKAVK